MSQPALRVDPIRFLEQDLALEEVLGALGPEQFRVPGHDHTEVHLCPTQGVRAARVDLRGAEILALAFTLDPPVALEGGAATRAWGRGARAPVPCDGPYRMTRLEFELVGAAYSGRLSLSTFEDGDDSSPSRVHRVELARWRLDAEA